MNEVKPEWVMPSEPGDEVVAISCYCHGWVFTRYLSPSDGKRRVNAANEVLWIQDQAQLPVGGFAEMLRCHRGGLFRVE